MAMATHDGWECDDPGSAASDGWGTELPGSMSADGWDEGCQLQQLSKAEQGVDGDSGTLSPEWDYDSQWPSSSNWQTWSGRSTFQSSYLWTSESVCRDDVLIGDTEQENRQCDSHIAGKPSLACAGLMNLGNTCFLNSVLQCLTYTVPFAKRVKSGDHKASCQVKGFCVMCALEDHMKEVFSAVGKTVSPSNLVDNLSCILAHFLYADVPVLAVNHVCCSIVIPKCISDISKSFVLGQQQDAHECFFLLIEVLQKCCASDGTAKASNTADSSFVSDIFIGLLRSQVKCNSCFQSSYSAEVFLGLSLEVEDCASVAEALSRFTAEETLEEDNKVVCTHCKNLVKRSKQFTCDKPPLVLPIHLKRFRASAIFPTKIERKIDYGLSLDLMPFISKTEESDELFQEGVKYSLYAVLVHSGWSTASGHYFCFVRTSPGTWHCMNDSMVLEVSEQTVLEQEAYILFYIRDGMEALSRTEIDALPSNGSCIKSVIPNISQTNIDCGTCPTTVSVNVPKVADDVTADSQVKVTLVNKSTCVLKQDEPNALFETCTVKHASMGSKIQESSNKAFFSTNGGSSSVQSSEQSDKENGKRVQCRKVQNTTSSDQDALTMRRSQNSVSLNASMRAVPDSFQKGTQHTYMRLLSSMPASRRQALLASAFSGQEVERQSSLAAGKPALTEKSKASNRTRLSEVERSGNMIKQHHLRDGIRKDGSKKVSTGRCQHLSDLTSSLGAVERCMAQKSDHTGKILEEKNHENECRLETTSAMRVDESSAQQVERARSSTDVKLDEGLSFDCKENERLMNSNSSVTDCLGPNRSDHHIASAAKQTVLREKPWADDYSHLGSRKLQRGVGGKRIIASLVDSERIHSCGKVSQAIYPKVLGGATGRATTNV